MAITVKHSKVSTIPDDADTSLVRPSDWNADHTLTGTVPVTNGGTGAATLTGYVYGNGTAAMTASTTIPSGDVSGLGTMATQNANAIAVTGGSINGTTIGATTASSGAFTYASTSSSTNTTPVLSYNASNCNFALGGTTASTYLQAVMQNKSGTAGASTNFAVSNDLGTDSTYYGEFGMNSSVFSTGTPADFFSLNNGIYYSGHDGDITYGSGNGYKTFLAWGTTGQSAHVINASGAIGLNTNITGTTNFGTAGYLLTSGGSSATPTWTNPTSIVGGAGGSTTQIQYNNAGALAGLAAFTTDGTNLTATGQLNLTNASNYNLYASGAGANYMAGGLGIGTTTFTGYSLAISKNITGATIAYGSFSNGIVQSDVTSLGGGFTSALGTQATTFTVTSLRQFYAAQGTFGSGSTVSNNYGFFVDANLTGATNNYGFFGNIAAATGRYNLYMGGTANNYLAGSLGIGTTSLTGYNLVIAKTSTGAVTVYNVVAGGTIQSDVTTNYFGFLSTPSTQATAFTLGTLSHFSATLQTLGATSVITTQQGFVAQSSLTGATNNYGFRGTIAAATGAYNLYMNGTADNYLAGSLGIGVVPATSINVRLAKNITGATTAYAFTNQCTVQSDVTTVAYLNYTGLSTQATAFTLASATYYTANQETLGATSAVTSQTGFLVQSGLTGATNNYGFIGNIAAATGRYNLYMQGTAANYFAGDMQFNKTVTAAGTTGAQTISKNAGTVNFAAAATSLVVTNTLVTANSIIICTVGTNDTTMKSASAVAAAGSFTIYGNAAATAETRVNFIVIN